MKKLKRIKDINPLAKNIVDFSIGESTASVSTDDPHAIKLGCLGGVEGGKARAGALTKSQRVKIAWKAAKTRLEKTKKGDNKLN